MPATTLAAAARASASTAAGEPAARAARPRPRAGGRDLAPRFRLGRRARRTTLMLHVLTSVGWFGAALSILFCAVVATTTTDPSLAGALARTVQVSLWLSVPLGLVSFVGGTILSLGTTWGFVRYWWVVVKLVINIAVVATDLLLVAPAARDAVAGERGAVLDSSVAHCVVLGLATYLSVLKPFGRTRRGRRLAAGRTAATP